MDLGSKLSFSSSIASLNSDLLRYNLIIKLTSLAKLEFNFSLHILEEKNWIWKIKSLVFYHDSRFNRGNYNKMKDSFKRVRENSSLFNTDSHWENKTYYSLIQNMVKRINKKLKGKEPLNSRGELEAALHREGGWRFLSWGSHCFVLLLLPRHHDLVVVVVCRCE